MTAAEQPRPGGPPAAAGSPSELEAFRIWLKVGFLSFGGPAGQIALMHRILVEEKRWIDEKRYLHALNYCMLLPGPEAQQLATYVGWLLHGIRGGITAGLLFVLPGLLVIVALSAGYAAFGEVPVVEGLLFGLKAAVLAVVAEALLRISRRALKGPGMVAVAVLAFVAIAFFAVPFPAIILSAALIGVALLRERAPAAGEAAEAESVPAASLPPHARPTFGRTVRMLVFWTGLWLAPMVVLTAALGPGHVFALEAQFFSVVAIVTFGGAYAVLAYVAQRAVEDYGWLSPDEMLTGLGLAETTPGPLILVLVFVGYLAGLRGETGLDPYLAGIVGALITTWAIFAPSFLFIFAGAPWIEVLRGNRALNGALAAITAAVVGVIANLALWFALHVLFAEVEEVRLGPLRLWVPELATFDPAAGLITAAAAVALLGFHAGLIVTLLGAALAGMALGILR